MNLVSYLPSTQFSVIAVSIALAGGLIVGAQYITRPPAQTAQVISADQPQPEADWQAALEKVQAEAPGLPAAPSEDTVQTLLQQAQSSNITNSVARSLLINLSDAGAQGLGSDIPTQEKLIADATARIGAVEGKGYTSADLSVTVQTQTSMHSWGNGVMKTFTNHPKANSDNAIFALGSAADHNDAKYLAPLAAIGEDYADLAADLADVPVPATLSPLYLQLINDLSKMAAAAGEMQKVVEDPLRGLAGLQLFQTSGKEATRVLTTMAEQLRKGGILFTKDEAGSLWSSFLTSP